MSVQASDTLHQQHAQDLWEAINTHLADKKPHEILGVATNATPQEIQRAYYTKNPAKTTSFAELITGLKQGSAGAVKENDSAAEKIHTAYRVLTNPVDSEIYKHWVNQQSDLARNLSQQAESAARKFSIRNPAVAMGAAALAIGSAWVGISATKRISEQKDEGNEPNAADRAQQTFGFAAAAAVLGAAALMWKVSSKGR